MKTNFFLPFLITFAATIALPIVSLAKPKPPSKVQYICEIKQGIPITYARTPTETVELIGWQSQVFSNSGYTPERRCQEVTARFQKHSDAGNLRFITTGKMNHQNVMCVAQSQGGNCISDGLLLTFEPKDEPQKVLVELFNVSTRVRKIRLTRGKPVYIDVDEYLSNVSKTRQSQPIQVEKPASQDNCNGSFFCSN
ncbi:COP23 domain-containing protein [Nostoc sp.]|uniref:COP23 domain-containing protein n=1 Tax=Nostoc sp. TaxID=1180 RepID=UPI002FF8860C